MQDTRVTSAVDTARIALELVLIAPALCLQHVYCWVFIFSECLHWSESF